MRRRRFEKLNLKLIASVILVLFFITISVGYSYLKQQLDIYGKSTKITQADELETKGYSTYSYSIVEKTKVDATDLYRYQISLKVINMDNDMASWVISFDVAEGYDDSLTSINGITTKEYENGRLSLINEDSYVLKGNSIDLEMQIVVANENFTINNLSLNGNFATENK